MRAVTNRLCGTCRFFEASTLQTHGWCRNAAYPRRDELALLRKTELGCREGWQKDYWEARADGGAVEGSLTSPEVAPGNVAAMPVGAGIMPLTPLSDDDLPPLSPAAAAPPGGQDIVVGQNAPLRGHSELDDEGVPLRQVRRSSVQDAHRRALERRQAERAARAERRSAGRAVPATVRAERPAASLAPSAAAPPVQPPPMTATRPPAQETAIDRVVKSEPADLEVRMFASTPEPQQGLPQPAVNTTPAAPPPPPLEVGPARPQAGQTERVAARFAAEPPPPPSAPRPTAPAAEPRYWDETSPGARFTRMRPVEEPALASEPAPPTSRRAIPTAPPRDAEQPARAVRQVGRPRPEPPLAAPAAEERPTRTIRSRTPVEPVEAPATEERLARTERSLPVVESPAPSEAPPRQADPSLVRQLESEWREQMLAAAQGRRCGSCRYYRGGESGRGACHCQFAPTYRQAVPANDLSCLNPLGSWWGPTDEGWLEKTEQRRPRRATPLLDALERELAEQVALANVNERRRNVR